jgi:hypothetical protein
MSHVALRFLASSAALAALCITTVVQAQTVRVRCESEPGRSKASVDGNDLAPGKYRAVLTSGDHQAKSPLQKAVGDEAEFDFDSNRKDVREGATKISRNFIVDDMATGAILDVDGNTVAQDTVHCKSN